MKITTRKWVCLRKFVISLSTHFDINKKYLYVCMCVMNVCIHLIYSTRKIPVDKLNWSHSEIELNDMFWNWYIRWKFGSYHKMMTVWHGRVYLCPYHHQQQQHYRSSSWNCFIQMAWQSRLWYHLSTFHVDTKMVHSVKLLTAQHEPRPQHKIFVFFLKLVLVIFGHWQV